MSTVTDSDSAVARRSIDLLLELYVSWREHCAAVRGAYQCWDRSDRAEGALAYAAYVAALDGEEHAAGAYAAQIERLSRFFT